MHRVTVVLFLVFVLVGFDSLYPVPQNAPCVSAGMNVPDSLQRLCPKATGLSKWYGVYFDKAPMPNSLLWICSVLHT